MAEYVEASTERTLEHLEHLIHIELLSEEEAKSVLKTRQNHEYRLARHKKQMKDYVAYIQYEITFLDMIKLRRQKSRNFAKPQLDFEQVNRIHSLFRTATNRFQTEVALWLSHIEFAKKHKMYTYAGRLYKRMLQIHAHRADLWLEAANWEVQLKQPDTARKLFLTGIRFNKKDRGLWLGYQRFELLQCLEARKKREEMEKKAAETEADDSAEKKPAEFEYPEAVVDGRLVALTFQKASQDFASDDRFIAQLLDVWHELCDAKLAEERVDGLFDKLSLSEHHPILVACWCKKPLIGAVDDIGQLEVCLDNFDDKIKTQMKKDSEFLAQYIQFLLKAIKTKHFKDRKSHLVGKLGQILEVAFVEKISLEEKCLSESVNIFLAAFIILFFY